MITFKCEYSCILNFLQFKWTGERIIINRCDYRKYADVLKIKIANTNNIKYLWFVDNHSFFFWFLVYSRFTQQRTSIEWTRWKPNLEQLTRKFRVKSTVKQQKKFIFTKTLLFDMLGGSFHFNNFSSQFTFGLENAMNV